MQPNQTIEHSSYESSAYQGEVTSRYQEEIVGSEGRTGYFAKALSECGVLPKGTITGFCWDYRQNQVYKGNLNGDTLEHLKALNIKDDELRLPLRQDNKGVKERLLELWMFIHCGSFILVPLYLLFAAFKGVTSDFSSIVEILCIWLGFIVFSKLTHITAHRFNLFSGMQQAIVIFNRQTGMVEMVNDKGTGYDHIPFEEFNAHHSKGINNSKVGNYGFGLLHYNKNLTYHIRDDGLDIMDALVHWELIKNFMDTSQPLADIPQFEYFREKDYTTSEYDKEQHRPKHFWYRVDDKFVQRVSTAVAKTCAAFPSKHADTLHKAKLQGYTVPQIIQRPWLEAESLADEPITIIRRTFVQNALGWIMVVN